MVKFDDILNDPYALKAYEMMKKEIEIVNLGSEKFAGSFSSLGASFIMNLNFLNSDSLDVYEVLMGVLRCRKKGSSDEWFAFDSITCPCGSKSVSYIISAFEKDGGFFIEISKSCHKCQDYNGVFITSVNDLVFPESLSANVNMRIGEKLITSISYKKVLKNFTKILKKKMGLISLLCVDGNILIA